jgi:hypothetical protein
MVVGVSGKTIEVPSKTLRAVILGGDYQSLERGLFPTLVQKRRLSVMFLKTDFIDKGVPARYHCFYRCVVAGRHNSLCN